MLTHGDIVLRAEKWLTGQSCKVVIRDPFRCYTQEQPDAIGWRDGVSILIEVKASRADFLSDKNKSFRKNSLLGMGDWRFYMCPPNCIKVLDLPKGWGLLYVHPRKIEKVRGVPDNCRWGAPPNKGNRDEENRMLVSALRRLSLRGYLPEIYKGPVGNEYDHGS